MPSSLETNSLAYWLIGLAVANLGTILSVMYFGGKIVWWASSIEQRVKTNEAHMGEHCEELKELREIILERRA